MEPHDAQYPSTTQPETPHPTSIFSQLRQFNPLSSFFASSTSPTTPLSFPSTAMAGDSFFIGEQLPTPTPTRPSTPRPGRFPVVKSIITGLSSRSTRQQPVRIAVVQTQVQREEEMQSETTLTPTIVSECTALHFADDLSIQPGFYESSDDTPPLTPESSESTGSLSPLLSQDGLQLLDELEYYEDSYSEDDSFTRPYSQEIKEGKRPAPPIDCDDTLLDDISSEAEEAKVVAPEDSEEWYGLEYTLELSTRQRRASETPEISTGEHSKSRESWLALHQGFVHPYYQDQQFSLWKDWHRYLDRQDERRRHRRSRAFRAHAKELAWLYVDEMKTRDYIFWQADEYGQIDKELLERLELIEAHRADSYYPPQKHNRAWHLKRSRSVATLNELCPPTFQIFSGPVSYEV
ncbi:MFS domain-containing protein [Mycena indigotica]|uniref:MFS domain-containing protein n=1 Tax=Mycena indigotica TaxID=2126181 RepID=A0A8H6SLL6_9AGAR|nr:MFS domain-containing protein [Mycena indigotica]KAF7301268.1 MFS domain-containing protein [Mycena indigotica]